MPLLYFLIKISRTLQGQILRLVISSLCHLIYFFIWQLSLNWELHSQISFSHHLPAAILFLFHMCSVLNGWDNYFHNYLLLVCCQGFLLTLHLSVLFMIHYLWFPNLPKWTCFTENNFSELPFNCISLIVCVCICLIFADLIAFSWYCYSSLCLFLTLLIFWNLRFLLHSWLLLVLQQELQKLECWTF